MTYSGEVPGFHFSSRDVKLTNEIMVLVMLSTVKGVVVKLGVSVDTVA